MTRTILMYGRSRAGKSANIAELSEYVMGETGKKSLVYTIDKGGSGPMLPHVDLGIIDLVSQEETDPWMFLHKATRGQIRDKSKWITTDSSKYGMVAFESLTGFADAMMADLANKAANGLNVGGQGNVSFSVTSDGETIKVSGSNMSHYNTVQTRILDEVWKSQKLNIPFIIWTASASRDDDPNSGGKVIGPAVVGKALTSEMPRHFDLTFRLDCLPSQAGKPERHILYLGNSIDQAAGNAVALGNTRTALGAPELPATIEPASIVKAITLIEEANIKAKEAITKRMASLTKKEAIGKVN